MLHGLIVDDHELFREGLRLLLEQAATDFSFDVAAGVSDALELLAQKPFALVLLDWNLEGLSGQQAVQQVLEAAPGTRLVVVSGETDAQTVRSAVDAGASGFIPKTSSPAILTLALRLICAGGIYLPFGMQLPPPGSAARLDSAEALLPALTGRQIEVFKALLRGAPNKVIARDLGITDATVKVHVTAIFRALKVKSRTEAVYVAAKRGLKID